MKAKLSLAKMPVTALIFVGLFFAFSLLLFWFHAFSLKAGPEFNLTESEIAYKFTITPVDTTQSEISNITQRITAQIKSPTSTQDLAELANLYISEAKKTGNSDYYSEAEKLAVKSLTLGPKDKSAKAAKLAIVRVLTARHQFREALQTLEEFPEGSKNSPEVVYLRAIIHLALSDFSAAFNEANTLIKVKPDIGSATLKALVLSQLGQDDLAFHYFKKAVQLEDIGEQVQSVLTRAQFAQFLIKRGEYDKALLLCDSGLKIIPTNAYLKLVKAQAFNSQKKYKEAYELMSKAFAESKEPTYLLNMLFSLKLLKRETDFKILSDEVLKIYIKEAEQNSYGHLLDLASVYYILNDFEKSAKTVLLDQQNRNNLRGDLILAKALIKLNKTEKAREVLEAQIAKGSTEVSLFYLMTELLEGENNKKLRDLFTQRIAKNNSNFNLDLLFSIP